MAARKLVVALAYYDRTMPFFNGSLQIEDMEVMVTDNARRDRMQIANGVENGPFDAWEMSFGRFCALSGAGEPLVAIPIFPRRIFPPPLFLVNRNAGIQSPNDLIGKRVGLVFWNATPSVMGRGILRREFGILPDQIRLWVGSTDPTDSVSALPDGVRLEHPPQGKRTIDILEAGELDALISPNVSVSTLRKSKNIVRLFPDFKERSLEFYKKYGFFPINHVMAMKRSVLATHKDAARKLYDACVRAQEIGFEYYNEPTWSHLVWTPQLLIEQYDAIGEAAWANGITRNRQAIEWFFDLEFEQGLTPRRLRLDEAFAGETMDT